MIRKVVLSAVIILILLFPVAASTTEWFAYDMYGQIRMAVSFNVDILEDVLPFDLDSVQVQYNQQYETIARGLRIGTYRLSSNSTDIFMTVSHTPLVLRTAGVIENNQINYRLYIMTGIGSPGFYSTPGTKIEIPGSAITSNGMVNLVDKYIYVTLDEGNESNTVDVLGALVPGTHESTITFEIWVAI